jgi:Trk-type K+ transport system membrane component
MDGGLGIVAFTVALAGRSGMTKFRLYRSEGRSETFIPGVVATASRMWRIYIVISPGFVNPGMSTPSEVLFIFVMWFGRP